MDIERYKQNQILPPDEIALDAAYNSIKDSYENRAANPAGIPQIFDGVALFDRMGRATLSGPLKAFKGIGSDPDIIQTLSHEIETAKLAGDDERVMILIRVSHLMGHTDGSMLADAADYLRKSYLLPPAYHPLRRLAGYLGQRVDGKEKMSLYDQLFEEHRIQLENKRQAAAAAAAVAGPGPTTGAGATGTGAPTGGPTGTGTGGRARTGAASGGGARTGTNRGPQTGPATGPATAPNTPRTWVIESMTGKSPEWVAAMTNVEQKWQDATQTLPAEALTNENIAATMNRLEIAFHLIQEEIKSTGQSSADINLRAMVEFLIPKIWLKPELIKGFFDNTRVVNPRNWPTPNNVSELKRIGKALFVPETLRNKTTKLTQADMAAIKRVYRRYSLTLHPDRTLNFPDASTSMKDDVAEVYKALTDQWHQVNDLLNRNP